MADVGERALLPYGADRTTIEGASVQLPASAVEMLGLAFHELATNAAKYGALLVPEGRGKIHWNLDEDREGAQVVKVTWRERIDPAVAPPMSRAFGSRLLEGKLLQDFSGAVKLELRLEALECDIWLPIAEVPGKVQVQRKNSLKYIEFAGTIV